MTKPRNSIERKDAAARELARATIYEQGNGLPRAGDYCSSGDYLYRVESIDSRIQTGRARGNYVAATVVEVPWSACDEADQHTAAVDVTTEGL